MSAPHTYAICLKTESRQGLLSNNEVNAAHNLEPLAVSTKQSQHEAKIDSKAIGSVGLMAPRESYTKAAENELEIVFWIGVPFWGNGYMPEAVRTLQKYAFEDLKCTGMWCGYYDGNGKSKRVQEKCGFIYHQTEENVPCPLIGDVRIEHFNYLSKQQWMDTKKN